MMNDDNGQEIFSYYEDLGEFGALVDMALAGLIGSKAVERLWEKDYTLWKPTPEEVANRLGWLDLPQQSAESYASFYELAEAVRGEGMTRVLLLGMGGSSLAPAMFARTFGGDGGLPLEVADTTCPDAVLRLAEGHPPEETLYVVATKSGGTVETISLLKFFWARAAETLGDRTGSHFVAVTDPGSRLEELARRHGFRSVVHGVPEVGGRFSALSAFGLLPAALVGADVDSLLSGARSAMRLCGPEVRADQNPAARLGVAMAELARLGRDKLTLVFHDRVLDASLADWVEQLVAESTGKEGQGVLPVVGERFTGPTSYGPDRFFVCMGGRELDIESCRTRDALRGAGHPVVVLGVDRREDIGALLFLWELATAFAGHQMGINPFDQPNVEAAKVAARHAIERYKGDGALPEEPPDSQEGTLAVWGGCEADRPIDAVSDFLEGLRPPGYLSLQAYLEPTAETTRALEALRKRLRSQLGVTVTIGYGPRFLHSTGQLHKGDAGRGRFIQLTFDHRRDAVIPDELGDTDGSIPFSVLLRAQVMGDRRALCEAGRRVIRVHLGPDPVQGLEALGEVSVRSRRNTTPPLP